MTTVSWGCINPPEITQIYARLVGHVWPKRPVLRVEEG
jgi:hypothetical protein